MRRLTNESVLILNKYYMAVQVAAAKEVVCAIVTGKARVVDQEYRTYSFKEWVARSKELIEDDLMEQYAGVLHSPSIALIVPQVVVFTDCQFNSPMIKTVRYSRRNVYQRDLYQCQYCQTKLKKDKLTLDHVHPKSQGGKSSWSNVVTACKPCNERKGNKLLSELGWKLPKVPSQPRWKSHVGIPFAKEKKAYWETFLG